MACLSLMHLKVFLHTFINYQDNLSFERSNYTCLVGDEQTQPCLQYMMKNFIRMHRFD